MISGTSLALSIVISTSRMQHLSRRKGAHDDPRQVAGMPADRVGAGGKSPARHAGGSLAGRRAGAGKDTRAGDDVGAVILTFPQNVVNDRTVHCNIFAMWTGRFW